MNIARFGALIQSPTAHPHIVGVSLSTRRGPTGLLKIPLFLLLASLAACSHKAKVSVPPQPQRSIPSAPKQAQMPAAKAPGLRVEPLPPEPARSPSPVSPNVSVSPSSPGGAMALPAPGPLIRIGLATNSEEIRISSSGEFFLLEKIPETLKEPVRGEITIRVETDSGAPIEVFSVQVAALSKMESAQDLRRRLSNIFSMPVVVRENPPGGLKQVRIGAFSSRQEAADFASGELSKAGFKGAVVVKDTSARGDRETVLVLRGTQGLFRVTRSGFLFQAPPGGDFLRFNGKPYRGLLDMSLNKSGRITIVNELGLEEYLLGVVPAELDPARYPQANALAAQSIAARTYALKNMGRFRSEGYDLTADIRTQVYGGFGQEKPAASEAVRSTFGLAIYYQNSLIDAMYTSTCGGRTEDFANVFDGPAVPYLRSVSCSIENSTTDVPGKSLQGTHVLDRSYLAEDGVAANRNLELAGVIGLATDVPPARYSEVAEAREIRTWVEHACRVVGKTPAKNPPSATELLQRGGFIRYAVESIFGAAEIESRISPADAKYYLGNLKDGEEVRERARMPLAYVMQRGLLSTYPDNTLRPGGTIRRGDALSLLVRWIEAVRPELLSSGKYAPGRDSEADASPGSLLIKWTEGSRSFRLVENLRLFKLAEGKSTPVENLRIIGNENLRFHITDGGRIDFLEVELNPTGASSDRFSPVASWRSKIPRAEIAKKIQPLTGNIGILRDLRPARLGNSGRVVQLEIIGSKGRVVVNGYKFRNAVGLRDTLFTISRSMNPDGTLESFTFDGRGWGHGVGLCQTGAAGMARAGRGYEEILKSYYLGVELRKAY